MKRFFVLVSFCIMICCVLNAQEQITAYDGTVLNIGDELTMGYIIFGNSSYESVKGKIINDYGMERFPNIKEDLTYSKVRITGFITPEKPGIFPNKNLIVLAKTEQGRDLYIEIDKAIENGEVVSVQTDPVYEDAVYLSDDLLLACVIRVNNLPVTDNLLLSFIGTKDQKLQKLCMADEFELNKVKPEFMELLNKLMEEFDFSAVYFIKNRLEIDKYDFSANGYPLYIKLWKENYLPYGIVGFYNFILVNNLEKYRLLPVALEMAEVNNKRRKGTSINGSISPFVYGKFYFKLLDKKMELNQEQFSFVNMEKEYRHRVVGAELVGLEVYDYPHCEYNFIGKIE